MDWKVSTFVLIDGMPIVSSLASVYGLNGIPTGMIEKVEIIKDYTGTLYGSQAVGGLIVITKLPEYSPRFLVTFTVPPGRSSMQTLAFRLLWEKNKFTHGNQWLCL